ncbi:MAG: alpha/beta hydrolase [Nocardioidaceae bacterium]|nr:alpha/beta hydrolase [Nocardioidaceae bacterium]
MEFREILSRQAAVPDAILRYAEHRDGLVDIFLPPSAGTSEQPRPLVVLVHGGFWREEYDRRHVRPLATALAQRGMVVAVPEYRRVGGLGGWPETAHDVEAALTTAPAMLEAVAPGQLDPAVPCHLVGHSAGGHLALWAGLRAGPDRVCSIMALAPVSDLVYAAHAGLGDNATQDLLGGGPGDVPDRYAAADTARMLPGDVPVTIIQGAEDKQVTVEMNRRLAAQHPEVTYVEMDGVDHFALIDPLSLGFTETVLPRLLTGII